MEKQRILFIITSFLVVVAVGGGIFLATRSSEGAKQEVMAELELPAGAPTASVVESTAMPAPPPGYAEYLNDFYGFSFFHPSAARITEYDEGGGAATITLENIDARRGLQIFIVPYADETISEERLLSDVPSGVIENIKYEQIGGEFTVPTVVFDSRDTFLGETREVWFIYNGFLFEITTLEELSDWSRQIIETWRFLK